MSCVRNESVVWSIAPRSPCWRGSSPIASHCLSVSPEVTNCEKPPSPSGTPIAAYRAPVSFRAASASRVSIGLTETSEATVRTASLSTSKAGSVDPQ